MASHRRIPQSREADFRGLLRSYRDRVVLTVCVLGLLVAWLVYGASVAGNSSPRAADGPTATVLSGPSDDPRGWPSGPSSESVGGAPAPAATAPAELQASSTAAGDAPATQLLPSLPSAAPPQRITYPAAGMDVTVRPLELDAGDTETQSIVPPETKDGYWLTPFGTPGAGSANTTYVVGHSWEGVDAPFNHLSSAATAGDEFTVVTASGSMTYRVESVTTYTKTSLKDSPIWAVVPNRLVLISCYTEDPWGKNVAVVASPLPV